MKWFERKFNFNDLEGTLPGILERLSDTPLRLEHKLSSIPESYYHQSIGETWSMKQQVGHLGDLEQLWELRFKDFLKSKPVLTAADLNNTLTHQANHNEIPMHTLLERFRSKRNHLCMVIKSMSQKAEAWTSKHPRLGTPMRPIDLAYFIAEHDDHHLAMITKLNSSLNR